MCWASEPDGTALSRPATDGERKALGRLYSFFIIAREAASGADGVASTISTS